MKEIERKFLVSKDTWKKCTLLKKVNVRQGYLSKSQSHQVRIRVLDDQAAITIKGPRTNLTREEFEYTIPLTDGEKLLELSVTPIISKTRYYLYDDTKQMWEIDVYKGINRGLVIAEIEMESEKQIVKLPTWIGKEVTHDRRYTNTYLTQHKAPK
jgi:CYTH domain-containing protein